MSNPLACISIDSKELLLIWPYTGIICMRRADERRRYIVTSSLIGWAHTQNWSLQTAKVSLWSAYIVLLFITTVSWDSGS